MQAARHRYLFKEQIAEGLGEFSILHQQEVAQRLKVLFHSQLHEEVVHHRFIHQRHTVDDDERKVATR